MNTKNLLQILEQLVQELHPGQSKPQIRDFTRLDSDLGIDSLTRMELLRRVEQGLSLRLDEQEFVIAETVADLTRLCVAHSDVTSAAQTATTVAPPRTLATHPGFPTHALTLVDALQWHAQHQGDNTFVYYYPGAIESPNLVSYQTLWDAAHKLSSGLRHYGINPGQSVALMLPTSETFLVSFFAILMAGAVPVPIYPPQRMTQIEAHLKRQIAILSNANAVLLITVPEAKQVGRYLKARLPKLLGVVTVDELPAPQLLEIIRGQAQNTAFIQYTSGSTGIPKGVVLSHANLLANIRAMGQALKVTADDAFASWLPLYHDMGLIGAFLGSLYHGFPLILMPPLSFIARPHRWLTVISKHRATLSGAPNFAYEICASKIKDDEIAGIDLSSLRFTCNGAEPVNHETLEKFCQRFAAFGFKRSALAPVYGLAECSVGLSFPPVGRGSRVDTINADVLHKQQRAQPSSDSKHNVHVVGCGFPLPNHEIRIIDDIGAELGDREVGRLQFRGPSATQCYFQNPGATQSLLMGDGWLNSGDYAYIANGEVFITGRSKDIIIRAGRNIYPYELEQAIGAIAGVHKGNVAVFGSYDAQLGTEKLVVLAETREQKPEKLETIRNAISEITSDMVQLPPDDVVLAPLRSIPKTSSGKIRRVDCRLLYESKNIGKNRNLKLQFLRLAANAIGPFLKRLLRIGANFFYSLWAWFLFITMVLLCWPLVLLIPGKKVPVLIMKALFRSILFLLGISYRVSGKENIPTQRSVVLVSNHVSYLDVFVLGLSLPAHFHFVAKAELKQHWAIRVLLTKMNTHFVERFNVQQSLADAQAITSALKPGDSLVYFPEGTFTRAPGLRAFKMGAFTTAAQAELSILPVAMRGTRSILRGSEWRVRRGAINLVFGPLISCPEELRGELAGDHWNSALYLRNKSREFILLHCGEPDLES